jgi:Carboxypeptidase regulatory-like domain
MRMFRRSLILLLTVCLMCLPTWSGTQNATITGSVYASGALLSGATVRLINASTGFSQIQITGPDGIYTFTNVPPAENYVVSVEKTGFSPKILTNITVQVNEEKLVLPPFRLESVVQPNVPSAPQAPAQAPSQAPAPPPSQHPTPVQAPPPQPSTKAPSVSLDLLSTTQSGVEDSGWVHTLPLINRDFIDLALLVPGTFPVEQGSVLQGASLVVDGARADMNNFLLDGADNNDYTINQSLPFQIVEAMQEFRVQASTENAEFGRSGGAQINVVSRSGSNAFHGELFEFNRNSALSAGNFFSGYSGGTFNQYARELQIEGLGNPLTNPTLAALYNLHNPEVNQNQFGGNIGGAFIPDKLFGFFNWESFRLANPRPLFEQVPGTLFRSASACAATLGLACNPNALALFNLYPSPNVPVTPFTNPASFPATGGDGAFSIGQAPNRTDSDNLLGRVDWRVSSRASMSFKHNIQWINQLQAGNTAPSPAYPGNGTYVNGRNQNVSYNYVQQFTPLTSNEFRFGWNRFRLTTTAPDAAINPKTLGFQNLNSNIEGLPTITVGGIFTTAPYSPLGANQATPSNRADNVWSLADSIGMTRGRHNWKFGGEFRLVRLNINNGALGRGLITLFSSPVAAEFGTSDVASIARVCPHTLPSFGTVFAEPCSQFGSGFERNFSANSGAGYFQDQWRIRPNFTINYGIRYEVNTAPVELHNRLVNFYPNLGTQGALVRGGSTTEFDPFGNVIGTAPQSVPRAGYNTDYGGWGPRFGFAWDPWSKGKTVLRAGYALMFDQQPLEPSVNQLLNPPFIQQNLAFFPFPPLSDTFSVCGPAFISFNGCLTQSANPLSISKWVLSPYSITAIDPHNKSPYVHQYHIGIEQQLGTHALIEVAYVGSAGHRLSLLRDISECPNSAFLSDPNFCFGTNASGQFTKPFSVLSILDQDNVANSNFNSLQVRLDTRNFHGLQLHTFYQWSKSIDDASSLQPQVFLASPQFASIVVSATADNPDNFAGANNISPTLSLQGNLPLITTRPRLPQDSINLAGERARSDFDIRNRFVVEYVYSVPRWAPVVGSGWQLAGITTLQSGQPFTVYSDFFGTPLRPNVLGPVPTNMNNSQAAIDHGIPAGFPGSVFDLTPTFQLQPGSLGRNALGGPKFVNFDFSVLKDTHLGKSERANLQFRAEFFNLFNNVNFHQPYSRANLFFAAQPSFATQFPGLCRLANNAVVATCYLPDPFFGQILQAFPARQVQFALKLLF